MLHALLSPYVLNNGTRVKNRIWLAPMTNEQSNSDGTLSDEELHWLALRARGGFGALITAAAHVRAHGQSYPGQLAAFADEQIKGLSRLAAVTSAQSALSILQVVHGGLRSSRALTGVVPVAPSAVELSFPGFVTPKALDVAGIGLLIDAFAASARRAQSAGLSGVEIHAANGYLFTPFLSTVTNLRTDEWGGSIDNRARLLLHTVDAIRAVVKPEFVVGVRLRAEDFPAQRGFGLDETLAIIELLNGHGVTYVHLAASSATETSWSRPADTTTNLRRVRDALAPGIDLVGNGGVWTLAQADAALGEGADFVAIGKAAISVPDLPRHLTDPAFRPAAFPLTRSELRSRGVSPKFADYLRNFRIVRE